MSPRSILYGLLALALAFLAGAGVEWRVSYLHSRAALEKALAQASAFQQQAQAATNTAQNLEAAVKARDVQLQQQSQAVQLASGKADRAEQSLRDALKRPNGPLAGAPPPADPEQILGQAQAALDARDAENEALRAQNITLQAQLHDALAEAQAWKTADAAHLKEADVLHGAVRAAAASSRGLRLGVGYEPATRDLTALGLKDAGPFFFGGMVQRIHVGQQQETRGSVVIGFKL